MEQQRPLGVRGAPVVLIHHGVDVAIDEEQVFPSVVVIVDELGGPTEKRDGRLRYPGGIAVVGVVGIAVVAVEHVVVVGKGGVEETQPAVVLVVPDSDPHGRGFAAVLIQGVSGGVAVIFEGAVAFVDVEVIGRGVVGYQQVYLAVVVQVHEDRG